MAEEQQLMLLRKRHGLVKAQLSKFATYVERFSDARKFSELGTRLEKAEELWTEFEKIQTEIELVDDSEVQADHRDAFESTYFSVIGKARELKLTHSNGQSQTNHTCSNQNIKLPEFDGEYGKWIQFSDTFRAIIHNNNTLSTTQKFYYLRSCLNGDAARALDTLEALDTNYEVAWDILKERFENKNVIIHNHLKTLFELPQVIKDSHVSLRNLADSMAQNLRALGSLGQPVKSWDSIVIFLIASKLESVSRNEWEKTSVKRQELPQLDSFKRFLDERCQILERLSKDSKQSDKQSISKESKDKAKGGSLTHMVSNTIKCPFCKGSHSGYSCKDLLSLPVDKRLAQVRKLKLCTNCLRNNHFSKDCKAGGCKKCNGRHNTLLHFEETKNEHEMNEQASSSSKECSSEKAGGKQESVVSTHACEGIHGPYVLLATAKVIIFDRNGKPHKCRALLDNGSQSNFITKQLSHSLGLAEAFINLPISGVNQSITSISRKTKACIKSLYNDYRAELSYLIVDNITQELPNRFYNTSDNELKIPEGLSLADPRFNYPEAVDLLLGAGIFWELLCVGQIQLGERKPFLRKTKLGWVVSGTMALARKGTETGCYLSTVQEVRDNLERFWEIEEILPTPKLTREEYECEALFVETAQRGVQGRFTVQLPFRTNVDRLGDSLEIATKRFYVLERRLDRDLKLKEQYVRFMNEYQELGHITEVSQSERDCKPTCYLAHHGVLNDSSATTKLRVVFDASAKTSSGLSLNDSLIVGPIIQDNLFAILLRFRMREYVITAEVIKMYRQVNVYEPHRDFQRILWRSNKDEPIRHFKLNTLTYGTAPASFEAVRSMHQTAMDKRAEFPEACNVILTDFYMDDLISGAETITKAKELAREINVVLNSGCFQLHKWNSNNEEILEGVQSVPGSSPIFLPTEINAKTLGLSWNAKDDFLRYQACIRGTKAGKVTKRTILSSVAQLFNPLGLVSPTIVLGKILMQKIWKLGIGWDESLPLDLLTLWKQFNEDVEFLDVVSVPRYVLGSKCIYIELHEFSDASEAAYGSCVYMRTVDESNNITARLLCAKSHVAPLKAVSLPRLELCGTLLLARLLEQVSKALNRLPNLKYDRFCWCDSTIVLAWIATESRLLKTFVANRVAEIQRTTDRERWFHVSSNENPADIVSRGMKLSKLATSKLWWMGRHG